ncbi:MAG: hypothetical protein XD95_0224 [Microgenomates bacterium 39_7]|nr:MAG: hypothetical protein XD95_0224 [Microgenomates bacterium 39_7]
MLNFLLTIDASYIILSALGLWSLGTYLFLLAWSKAKEK